MDKNNTAKVTREYCARQGHRYGSHIDGPFGLECIACLKEAGDLFEDYEPCGDCGFDHGYEQDEAVNAHRALGEGSTPDRVGS